MKQKRNKPAKLLGFSLVELMAAAAIMGILVSLALPRYRLFVARSRMVEAKINLGIIATLEQSYFAEYQTHANMPCVGGNKCTNSCATNVDGSGLRNELGFRMTDCDATRYEYTVTGASNSTFSGLANSNENEIYPNCDSSKLDQWTINEKRKLEHDGTNNVVKQCHE